MKGCLPMYDVMIIGGGPAGVTAGIYAKRAGLSPVIFEKMFVGGQISMTSELENYPGFGNPISGADFALQLMEQCQNIGVPIINEEVTSAVLEGDVKKIETAKGEYEGKTLIIATGAVARKLGLPEEDRYMGRGVSYCATCDGSLYKDKTVAIIGGGNTAVTEAIYLAGLAKKVYVIHRRDSFRAARELVDVMKEKKNIELLLNNIPVKLTGESGLEAIDVQDNITEEIKRIPVDGVFVAIGRIPDTRFLEGDFMDDRGYIKAGSDMETGIDGVFAAGDVNVKKLRQVATAVADGAIAATTAIEYIQSKETKK